MSSSLWCFFLCVCARNIFKLIFNFWVFLQKIFHVGCVSVIFFFLSFSTFPPVYLSCVTHPPHSNSISPQFVGGSKCSLLFLVLFFLFSSDRVWLLFFFFLHHSVKKKNQITKKIDCSSPFQFRISSDCVDYKRKQNSCEIRQLSRRERRYFLTA